MPTFEQELHRIKFMKRHHKVNAFKAVGMLHNLRQRITHKYLMTFEQVNCDRLRRLINSIDEAKAKIEGLL